MSNVFDSGGNRVVGCERRVHNNAEAFYLQVGLVQSLKRTAIIKVVVEWDGEVRVCDCSSKGGMFSGGWE